MIIIINIIIIMITGCFKVGGFTHWGRDADHLRDAVVVEGDLLAVP